VLQTANRAIQANDPLVTSVDSVLPAIIRVIGVMRPLITVPLVRQIVKRVTQVLVITGPASVQIVIVQMDGATSRSVDINSQWTTGTQGATVQHAMMDIKPL